MEQNLKVGDLLMTKQGQAKIRRIGTIFRSDRIPNGWAVLTLDLDGMTSYAVAREDELEPA